MTKSNKRVGVLTAGGDSPGLNAAIRGLGKAALGRHGMELIGFRDGVRGLAENRAMEMTQANLSGILTAGGTILGTSRDKVHRMVVDGEAQDMIPTIAENFEKNRLDCLVMLGGGGTAKNAMRLAEAGLNVRCTCPKPSTRTWHTRTTRSGSRRRWRSPQKPSTVFTPQPTATTGSSWSRSWATRPGG